jgi:hypothetical protein
MRSGYQLGGAFCCRGTRSIIVLATRWNSPCTCLRGAARGSVAATDANHSPALLVLLPRWRLHVSRRAWL